MADLSLRDLRQAGAGRAALISIEAERQEDVGQGDRLVGAKRQGSVDLRHNSSAHRIEAQVTRPQPSACGALRF